jgi:hypothetical protein
MRYIFGPPETLQRGTRLPQSVGGGQTSEGGDFGAGNHLVVAGRQKNSGGHLKGASRYNINIKLFNKTRYRLLLRTKSLQ